MTNQDTQSPRTESLLQDVKDAVQVASDALNNDSADAAVAVLAGLLLVGRRIAGAITEASKLLDRRLDLALSDFSDRADKRIARLCQSNRECAAIYATGDADAGTGEPH